MLYVMAFAECTCCLTTLSVKIQLRSGFELDVVNKGADEGWTKDTTTDLLYCPKDDCQLAYREAVKKTQEIAQKFT